MDKSTIIIVCSGVYLLVCVLIGLAFSGRQKTLENYFVAGRQLGPMVTAMAVAASFVSGWTFIGSSGIGYAFGLVLIAQNLIFAVQAIFPWIFLARKLRILTATHNCLTVPDALYARYRSKAVSVLGAVGIFFGLIGYTAAQLLALGTMMASIFSIPFFWAMAIGVTVLALYTILGGIEGAIWVDVFQGTIMMFASVFVFIAAYRLVGGPGEVYQAMKEIDPELVRFTGKWSWPFLASYAFAGLGAFVMPHLITKFYMIKEIGRMKTAALFNQLFASLMCLIYVSIPFVYLTLEHRGLAQHLTNPDNVAPVFVLNYLPAWLAGVLFAGALSAIMSTVSSFLNLGSAVLVRDILQTGLDRNFRHEVRAARIGTVVFLLGAVVLAFTANTLVVLLGAASVAIFGSTLIPSLVIGLWSERATARAAIISMSVGMVMSVGMQGLHLFNLVNLPYGMMPGGIGVVAATATMLILTFFSHSPARLEPVMKQVIALPLFFFPSKGNRQ
jgi:SSS family transporter